MVVVNEALTADAERALALSYAPVAARVALTTLFALDARLRRIALVARDPTIGMMRLTWWSEALERLDLSPPPAEPLLQALAGEVLPRGVTGAALAGPVVYGPGCAAAPRPVSSAAASSASARRAGRRR